MSSSGAAKEPGRGRTNVAGRPESVSRSRVLIGQTLGSRLTVQLPLSTHSNRLIRVVGFTTPAHRLQGETGEAALLAAARTESRQEGGGPLGEYEKSWRNRTLRRGRAPHTASRCTEGGHSSPEAYFLKQREKGKRDLSWEGKGADCWRGDGNLVAGQSFRPDAALAARLVQSATGALHALRGRRLPPPSTSLRRARNPLRPHLPGGSCSLGSRPCGSF